MQSTPEFLAKFCFKLAGILPNQKFSPLTKPKVKSAFTVDFFN